MQIRNTADRRAYIRDRLREHYEEALSLGHEVFCIVLQGSQNYNLDIYSEQYQSDIDTKAIVLPSFNDFCAGIAPISTTHERQNNEHIDLKDIRVMFDTFKKQNVNFVEIMFSDFYCVAPKYQKHWAAVRRLGEAITHCHPAQTLKTMAGLSFEKHKALCHPYPSIKEKIDKYGYDGKQLHHILRINEFMKNYIAGMSFKECLTAHDPSFLTMLINAKLNAFSLQEAKELADTYDRENCALKDRFIDEHGVECDARPYQALTEIKTAVLKQWFREELK